MIRHLKFWIAAKKSDHIARNFQAAPIALPAAVITVAGYIAVVGTVVTAVSQTAVIDDAAQLLNGGGTESDPKIVTNLKNSGGRA